MSKVYDLETKVPHFGKIKAIKRGKMEYEYLLLKEGVTTWLSHSDIEAMFEANPNSPNRKRGA